MNIYRHVFTATCPNNGRTIAYAITIEAVHVIMAEDIVSAGKDAAALQRPYHESIADMMFERFGGKQRMTAFHHGVDIETLRG